MLVTSHSSDDVARPTEQGRCGQWRPAGPGALDDPLVAGGCSRRYPAVRLPPPRSQGSPSILISTKPQWSDTMMAGGLEQGPISLKRMKGNFLKEKGILLWWNAQSCPGTDPGTPAGPLGRLKGSRLSGAGGQVC